MRIRKGLLTSLGISSSRADQYLPDLNALLPQHNIDTPLRISHFLSQLLHESSYMRLVEENLNYSTNRLVEIFRKYFTESEAAAYAGKPEMIASRVYGNRMGNGDEASGDGYRYRGRGLIQLTGKNNYRKFSRWISEDVVAHPDLVANKYAVHSAVYYWVSNNLNAFADIDDVRQVTKKINGGLNGLADRIAILDNAKALTDVDVEPPVIEHVTHRVTATKLNIRSRPKVAASTKIGSLPQGTEIMKAADAPVSGWLRVRAVLNGHLVEGFVASRYLEAISAPAIPEPQPFPFDDSTIPPAHLTENRHDITRHRDGGRAYPLGEADRPPRSGSDPHGKTQGLITIVEYLDSENREHRRYGPKGGTTYCNIYAHDYCYLAGVYLPRVWWTERALRRLRDGDSLSAKYDNTVRELNANMLHDWFEDYGLTFGWKRVFDLDVLQAAANNGEVCIIVAKRSDLNRSGHIVAVVPEQEGFEAIRSAAGEVLRPLESQAGSKNHRFFAKRKSWWANEGLYQSFGFWRHA